MSSFQRFPTQAAPPKKSGSGMTTVLIIGAVVLLCCCPIGGVVGFFVYAASIVDDVASEAAALDAQDAFRDAQLAGSGDAQTGLRTQAAWNQMVAIDSAAESVLDDDDSGLAYWRKLQAEYRTIDLNGTDADFIAMIRGWQSVADEYVSVAQLPSFLQTDSKVESVKQRVSDMDMVQSNTADTLQARYGISFAY